MANVELIGRNIRVSRAHRAWRRGARRLSLFARYAGTSATSLAFTCYIGCNKPPNHPLEIFLIGLREGVSRVVGTQNGVPEYGYAPLPNGAREI